MLFHEECALNVNTFASSVNFVLNQLNEDIFPAIKNATMAEPNWDQKVFNAVNYLECLYTGGDLKFGLVTDLFYLSAYLSVVTIKWYRVQTNHVELLELAYM